MHIHLQATSHLWHTIEEVFNAPAYETSSTDFIYEKLGKFSINLAKKSMVATAALIAIFVTPFFLFYDFCCANEEQILPPLVTPPLVNRVEALRQRGQEIYIDFYLNRQPNVHGDRLDAIWALDNDTLEMKHNYIQWLFILDQPSGPEPTSPLLNEEIRRAFIENLELKQNLIHSFQVMLNFWGFQMDEQTHRITRRSDFEHVGGENWLRNRHNLLRMTRVLRSLYLLDEREYAESFYSALEDVYIEIPRSRPIIQNSLQHFWKTTIRSFNPHFSFRI